MFQSKPNMKRLTVCGSLLAIVGSTIGFTTAATAIPATLQKTQQAVTLPTPDGQPAVLLQLRVPAGRKVITYSATAVNFGNNEIVRCGVRVNGNFTSVHAAQVGVQPAGAFASTISGVDFLNSSVPTSVELACVHDGAGDVPYIDPGAELAVF